MFQSLDQVLEYANTPRDNGYAQKGVLNLAQTCHHLAYWISYRALVPQNNLG
jgi:hypothetical protein